MELTTIEIHISSRLDAWRCHPFRTFPWDAALRHRHWHKPCWNARWRIWELRKRSKCIRCRWDCCWISCGDDLRKRLVLHVRTRKQWWSAELEFSFLEKFTFVFFIFSQVPISFNEFTGIYFCLEKVAYKLYLLDDLRGVLDFILINFIAMANIFGCTWWTHVAIHFLNDFSCTILIVFLTNRSFQSETR